ncbi:MAG: menaquinone-dependent protoporphyrinogen IX dehydrogenase [Endozoicomonadaceae bacterium]|nr:menaquinone-dependent protoporphyrinogen IX dehydrogenase [Endozoicomonadaceae bacterium]
MLRQLIIYHSTHGHTHKICLYMQSLIKNQRIACDIKKWNPIDSHLPVGYTSYLFIMPVKYGKHPVELVRLLCRESVMLQQSVTGIISVNLTARKPNKASSQDNPYLQSLLSKLSWSPTHTAVFAGALNYSKYVWYDRFMIRFIMKLTGGPTHLNTNIEFTNWTAIDQFIDTYLQSAKTISNQDISIE